jgi:ATP-binding cassette subfamily F protein 3
MREFEKKDIVTTKETPKVEKKTLSFEAQKAQKSLQNKLSKIESQIQQLEKQIQQDDLALASHYDKHIEDAHFFTAYEQKKKDLDRLLEDWENVQMEIESI